MLKLIRLEWKKNNVGKYIRNVVIMSALICLFIFALCYLGIANDPEQCDFFLYRAVYKHGFSGVYQCHVVHIHCERL